MADPARARRLAVRIRQLVAEVLERDVKDPRVGFVTVTDARVTSDLATATVFYTTYGDDVQREATREAVQSATGMLRREVGRRLGVRVTPTLTLVDDHVPEQARALEDVLERVRREDAEKASAAVGAVPVGDADPYRRPREDDPDHHLEEDRVAAGPGTGQEPDAAEDDPSPGAWGQVGETSPLPDGARDPAAGGDEPVDGGTSTDGLPS